MKKECTHPFETLIHGLETIFKVKAAIGELPPPGGEHLRPDYKFIAGALNILRDHEAGEVDLYKEAQDLLSAAANKDPLLFNKVHDFQEKFIDRALPKLIECECAGKSGSARPKWVSPP